MAAHPEMWFDQFSFSPLDWLIDHLKILPTDPKGQVSNKAMFKKGKNYQSLMLFSFPSCRLVEPVATVDGGQG